MTATQLNELWSALGRLLFDAELHEPDQPVGCYPPEWLMALRLAWTAAGRAAKEAALPRVEVS